MAISDAHLRRLDLVAILLNPLILLLGVGAFGWTLAETLLLYWIEPVVAWCVRVYLELIVPMRYAGRGIWRHPAYRRQVGRHVALTAYIGAFQVAGFWAIWRWVAPPALDWELGLLALMLFAAAMFPIWGQERQGLNPRLEWLPAQTRILVHPIQFLSTYAILTASLAVWALGGGLWPAVGLLVVGKAAVEYALWRWAI